MLNIASRVTLLLLLFVRHGRTKISYNLAKKPIANFREKISRYVIFRWAGLSAKVKKWINLRKIEC